MIAKVSGNKDAVLTLTGFYLELLSVSWFYKGFPEKPDHIYQPQEWKKRKSA